MTIEIKINNPVDVQRLMKSFQEKVGLPRLSLILKAFGEDLVNSVQRNFDLEGRPNKWTPLKPATIRAWLYRRRTWISTAKRPRRVAQIGPFSIPLTKSGFEALYGKPGQPGGRKILTDTAALRNSVHWKLIGKTTLALRAGGQAAPYAPEHQFGAPKKHIPARPYLMIQPEDWATLKHYLTNYLTKT